MLAAIAPEYDTEPAVKISYGTAGFRQNAETLVPAMFRVGILAALRSKCKGACIGVMITASHNPECDNGVKVVDPLGEMLESSWESWATKLANCSNDGLEAMVQTMVTEVGVDVKAAVSVAMAMDTRPSSPLMAKAVAAGVAAAGGTVTDFGLLTTPQLHYVVRCTNDPAYGTPTEQGYNEKLSTAFKALYASSGATEPVAFHVDCANGIGAGQLRKLLSHLTGVVDATVCNDGSVGKVNDNCGADYVKTNQKAPPGIEAGDGVQCASLDGDADRLMFFYNKGGKFQMLDGDRIAILCAVFFNELVSAAGLKMNLGIVQTAYANGGSTKCLEKLGIPVACAKTGVKHLHHLALNYDIGVYFEANGHGTILFSDDALGVIAKANGSTNAEKKALTDLRSLIDLINQTVGDAISDLLLVQIILIRKKMSMPDWAAMYDDLPNRLVKVKVADRSVVGTTNAERTCTSPAGLQDAIDALVAEHSCGRAFVRPSGTEDVVRVYAEAETRELADDLNHKVSLKVFEMANGVGNPPEKVTA